MGLEGIFDAWEQRKLGDESDVRDGTHDSPQYFDTGYPLVTSKNLKNHGLDLKDVSLIAEADYNAINHRSKVDEGDILFGMIGTIGNPVLVRQTNFAIKNVALIKEHKRILNQFLIQLLKSPVFERYIKSENAGGTQKFLALSKIRSFEFKVPNLEEQQKIGTFFKQLDNTIALHQRKLDTLKLMKKGFLQQMFPEKGEKVPKLRFADFEEEWEQRKIRDFLTESKTKGSNGLIAKKLTVKLWRKGIIAKEEIYSGSSATKYYVRKAGQFMYGKLDFINQAFGIIPTELDGYESTIDSPAFDFQNEINPHFFFEYISLRQFYEYQGNIANGSRIAKRIHTETFFEMPILTPSQEEQEKIGLFIKQVDSKIDFHQTKLNILNRFKKAYLQNMFI
ncbi:restriction endonuclease subunit S [Listeria ivanovii subsp. londoniensis]|uniref:restriction endonuclease subunit S n=1 Tax=Listeria ivanovii TaxID=1638 RepID=UPI001904006A|nr:restriction endonuclease subunit S [Listeria ivanovii]MBK1995426.1 restriction endonuclease subunit S [Listeria ivanovii subsp. londoniensis]